MRRCVAGGAKVGVNIFVINHNVPAHATAVGMLDHDTCVTRFGADEPRVHACPGCEGNRHLSIGGPFSRHGKIRHYSMGRQGESRPPQVGHSRRQIDAGHRPLARSKGQCLRTKPAHEAAIAGGSNG